MAEPCDDGKLDPLPACVTSSSLFVVFFMQLPYDGSINISWCTCVPVLKSLTKEILDVI